jgi:hypothetical protein
MTVIGCSENGQIQGFRWDDIDSFEFDDGFTCGGIYPPLSNNLVSNIVISVKWPYNWQGISCFDSPAIEFVLTYWYDLSIGNTYAFVPVGAPAYFKPLGAYSWADTLLWSAGFVTPTYTQEFYPDYSNGYLGGIDNNNPWLSNMSDYDKDEQWFGLPVVQNKIAEWGPSAGFGHDGTLSGDVNSDSMGNWHDGGELLVAIPASWRNILWTLYKYAEKHDNKLPGGIPIVSPPDEPPEQEEPKE